MNQIEMNYTFAQKMQIKCWKEHLVPRKRPRIYEHIFEFNKYAENGQPLYHLNIMSNDPDDGSVYVGGEFGF